jgi:type II secretory pathway pseudopilin PulG
VNEPAEDPVGQASSKVVQYVSLATMAAEAIAQRRQQRVAEAASTDERAAAALRAQQTSAHTAARLQWQPVLDPRRAGSLSLADTGWRGRPRRPGDPPTPKPNWPAPGRRTGCASSART